MKAKTIIVPALILGTLALLGISWAKESRAATNSFYPPIVQKLVERFNLDTGEVQQVFDESREERGQRGQARFEERLSQLVTDGEITEAQKEAIMAKKAEMQAHCEGNENLSFEERHEFREAHREEIKNWAEENGINLTQLLPMNGFRGKHNGFYLGK